MYCYISLINGADEYIDYLWLIVTGSLATVVHPVRIVAISPEILIHIMLVVRHGDVFARVKGGESVETSESKCAGQRGEG